jgi:hypothetical protein
MSLKSKGADLEVIFDQDLVNVIRNKGICHDRPPLQPKAQISQY